MIWIIVVKFELIKYKYYLVINDFVLICEDLVVYYIVFINFNVLFDEKEDIGIKEICDCWFK